MDNKEFKRLLQVSTEEIGFKRYKNNNYYYQDEKVIVIIETQRSNYDNSYYINYGFWIRAIHKKDLDVQRVRDCDVIGRFINNINDITEFDFHLPMIGVDSLLVCFKYNIDNNIKPVIDEGIEKYFELFPNAIFTAKLCLKEYLEHEC